MSAFGETPPEYRALHAWVTLLVLSGAFALVKWVDYLDAQQKYEGMFDAKSTARVLHASDWAWVSASVLLAVIIVGAVVAFFVWILNDPDGDIDELDEDGPAPTDYEAAK